MLHQYVKYLQHNASLLSLACILAVALFLIRSNRKISQKLRLNEQVLRRVDFLVNEQKKMARSINQNINKLSVSKGSNPVASAPAEVPFEEDSSLTKLYVGNVDYQTTEEELAELFGQFGQIEMVNIPTHRYTGKTRGFGFVTFDQAECAERAMELNGQEFRGRQIQVSFAKEKETAV